MPPSEKLCREWIRSYMQPQKNVNHMHTSKSLCKMVEQDTGFKVSADQFTRWMEEEGFPPASHTPMGCEFRISSVPLRFRPKARVGGWLPSMDPYNPNRLG